MTINSATIRREVDELLTCNTQDVAGIYEKALDIFARYTAPGVVFSFRASEVNGQPYYSALRHRCAQTVNGDWKRVIQRLSGGPILEGPTLDVFSPHPREVNRFRDIVFEDPNLEGSPLKNDFLAPHGLLRCFRIMLYRGRRFTGWLGTFRTVDQPPFEVGLTKTMAPLIPALKAAYSAADQIATRGLWKGEKLAIFNPAGHLDFASPDLRDHLRGDALEQVGSMVRALNSGKVDQCVRLVEGVEVRVTRVEGRGLSQYIAQLVPPRPILVDPLTPLTPTQREVAILAARGMTLPEIGQALNRSPNTAKVHMREIYRRLDISSRAELASLADD